MIAFALALAAAAPPPATAPTVRIAPVRIDPARRIVLPMTIGGRVQRRGTAYLRQWPGTYFEAAFRGRSVGFAVGAGDVQLRITVDAQPAVSLVAPPPGTYRIDGLAGGAHHVRIDVVSESQPAPTAFGGFFRDAATHPLPPPPPRARQIEFVGDSHTVGYGNRSTTRDCTDADVWRTTDTAAGIAGITAARYAADYRVAAISGRGIVRNYDGAPGDTVPAAYPFVLLDKATRDDDPAWHPAVIVVALGTNDFSTALKPGERWPTRAALHADYEATYTAFVARLRARDPQARIVLWATDQAGGEIAAEVRAVVDRVRAAGDPHIDFVPVAGLRLAGCHFHPDLADDRAIATALAVAIDAAQPGWAPAR